MAVTKKARLNNTTLSYQRNELVYEAVMTDLYLMGVIPSKEILEAFTGRQFLPTIVPPPAAVELEEKE
jgi:hypothetical protein